MDSPRPLPLRPALQVLDLGRRALAWPVTSQHHSRRNAMLASLEIRHRLHEQRKVDAYLASLAPRRPAASG
jgi:hypothetical protein